MAFVTYGMLFGLGVISSLALTPLVRRFAIRFGAVDHPGERRVNKRTMPRLGGLAVFGALLLSFVITAASGWLAPSWLAQEALLALALGATIVTILGAVDDFRSLSPTVKLAIQLLAATVVVLMGYRIETVFGSELGWLSTPVTIGWIVFVTNAFNLIDGLDGLAAGIGVIVSVSLFTIAVYSGHHVQAMVLAALAGALIGFLRYNFYPAQIFLGDTGSLLLGFVLGVVAISAGSKASTTFAILVPILALGVPIIDSGLAMVRRLLGAIRVVHFDEASGRYVVDLGRPKLFAPDRRHIHHRLLDLGISHRNAVLMLYGAATALGAGAFLLVFQQEPNHALLLGAFGIAAATGVRRLNYGEMRVLERGALLPIFDSPLVNLRLLHVLFDLVFIITSYCAAYFIWYEGQLLPEIREALLQSVPLVAFVQIASFSAAGLYMRSYRYTGLADLLTMARALVLGVGAVWAAFVVGQGWSWANFGIVLLDGYLLATFVVGMRTAFVVLDYIFKSHLRRGRRVLIYGAGGRGVLALSEIENNPSLDLRAMGFLDDSPEKRMRFLQGYPVYAPDALERLVHQREFDELVVSTAKIPPQRLAEIGERCELAGIAVRRFEVGLSPTALGAENESRFREELVEPGEGPIDEEPAPPEPAVPKRESA